MAQLQAVFYRAPDGKEPIDEFIDALADPDRQAAIDFQIDRLNMLTSSNPHLPFPHSSQIEGELRELRCHSRPGSMMRPAPRSMNRSISAFAPCSSLN
jgi:hypothetical protein